MKPIIHNDTIQIEITNACVNQCGNCTRFCGHHSKPFFMDFETFKQAVDSLVEFSSLTQFPGTHLVGMMGGEPLIHPDFVKMCNYLHSKISAEKCGLWSTFPPGFEHYRETIVETFAHVFLNDHTRDDVMHNPILVEADELPLEEWQKWYTIDNCWAQASWSASINPKGAYFCEIAASLAMLTDKDVDDQGNKIAWDVQPGWWTRSPMHYNSQIKEFCRMCGCGMPLQKRYSVENIDDVSPRWYERLKDTSPKIKAGRYAIHDLQVHQDCRQMATYKDMTYRDRIARRYGMFLLVNETGYCTPYLLKKWKKGGNEDGKVSETDECAVGQHSR